MLRQILSLDDYVSKHFSEHISVMGTRVPFHLVSVWVLLCVCVCSVCFLCVCVRERDREKGRQKGCVCVWQYSHVGTGYDFLGFAVVGVSLGKIRTQYQSTISPSAYLPLLPFATRLPSHLSCRMTHF